MFIALPQYSLQTMLFSAFDYAIVKSGENTNLSIKGEELSKRDSQEQVKIVSEKFLDKLYRYVRYTFELDQITTEDILQELFFQLPKKLKKIKKEKNIEPFLFRITHNFVIDSLRKHKSYQTNEGAKLPEEDFINKIQTYDGEEELSEKVEDLYKNSLTKVLIHKLSQKSRELIILFFFEHKSYEEIAKILGVKKSGVGTMLSRAKEEMKSLVKENVLLHNAITYDL